jgi:hypothetical protein
VSDAIHILGGGPPIPPPTLTEVVEDDAAPAPKQGNVRIKLDADGSLLIETDSGDAPPAPENTGPDDVFNRNFAEKLDEMALGYLASDLMLSIESDIQGRRDWEETADKAFAYLGVKLEDPSASVTADGSICKSVASVMLECLIKLWSVGRAELLPVSGPVKVRRDDPAPPAKLPQGIVPDPPAPVDADGLADALETDLNWYLTTKDREYYPDFSKMLWHRALIGCAFRKVYRSPIRRMPVSEWVKAQDLIVSNDGNHLSSCSRVTERIRVTQPRMRRLMVSGHFRDVALSHPSGTPTDTERADAEAEGIVAVSQVQGDFQHLVYECYCEIGSGTNAGLVGDLSSLERDETGRKPGYPLPYRVSIDVDSRTILEIRRDWRMGDTDHKRRRRYVKYGLIPGFGFYDLGMIHLTGNAVQTATMIQRATVDNALYANFPGGLYLKGAMGRQSSTVFRPNPGEWIGLDAMAAGIKISDVMMPIPMRDPSTAAMEVLQKVEGDVRKLSGVVELPVGEGRLGNTPVGTIMTYIESVTQVPGAVHKDDHRAQQEEYELLRELLAEEPSQLSDGNDSPARQWQTAEELMKPRLTPAADPNVPSQVHRMMRKQGMIALGGLPQFQGIANQRAIYGDVMGFMSGGDAAEFTMPPAPPSPPPPDPRVIAAQIKAQSQQASDAADLQRDQLQARAKMTEIAAEGQEREADRQSNETRTGIVASAAQAKAEAEQQSAAAQRIHDTANAHADRMLDATKHVQTLTAPLIAPEGSQQ